MSFCRPRSTHGLQRNEFQTSSTKVCAARFLHRKGQIKEHFRLKPSHVILLQNFWAEANYLISYSGAFVDRQCSLGVLMLSPVYSETVRLVHDRGIILDTILDCLVVIHATLDGPRYGKFLRKALFESLTTKQPKNRYLQIWHQKWIGCPEAGKAGTCMLFRPHCFALLFKNASHRQKRTIEEIPWDFSCWTMIITKVTTALVL